MKSQFEKKENKTFSTESNFSQAKSEGNLNGFYVDNRVEATAQRKIQEMANNCPQVRKADELQAMANNYSSTMQAVQKKEKNHALPENLKQGIEAISGHSLDDVKVHYNSAKPAQLNAHAYAQGSEIYVGPGQEKHLPHEAWHIVQQAEGRVKPTLQLNGSLVNDDKRLENEADVMGAKALSQSVQVSNKKIIQGQFHPGLNTQSAAVIQMDSYPYGAANTTPHVHVYKKGSHLKIVSRGRVRRYNIVQDGSVHKQADSALEEAAGNATLLAVIQGLINDAS